MHFRNTVPIALLFAVILLPFVLRSRIIGPGQRENRSRTSEDRLIIVTPHNQDIRREFSYKFKAWHKHNRQSSKRHRNKRQWMISLTQIYRFKE